ncbi:MAG: glycoside hydrolase family 19 protein [Pseudomonadota bacterium]
MITAYQLARATGATLMRASAWLPHVVATLKRFDIDTAPRQAAFLAQVGHESARLSRIEEDLYYSAERLLQVFGRHFTPEEAQGYARQPARIANRVYSGRLGNGDEASGDGWRYRGRGLIQITGRDNYAACAAGLGVDLVAHPDRLLEPRLAALSAGWYWSVRGLNELADRGDFPAITRRINGALNGQDERLALYAQAQEALA